MILDISGFTALGEELKKSYGEREGSALLAESIDEILSMITTFVYDFAGDVIKFAGDALICLFSGHASVESRETTLQKERDNLAKDPPELVEEQAMFDAKQCAVELLKQVSERASLE